MGSFKLQREWPIMAGSIVSPLTHHSSLTHALAGGAGTTQTTHTFAIVVFIEGAANEQGSAWCTRLAIAFLPVTVGAFHVMGGANTQHHMTTTRPTTTLSLQQHHQNKYGRWNSLLRMTASSQPQDEATSTGTMSVKDATSLLQRYDKMMANLKVAPEQDEDLENGLSKTELRMAVLTLNEAAARERNENFVPGEGAGGGRVIMGICASNIQEGLTTLKAWTGGLELPKGLLHGMDVDGVPIQLDGPVYLKYNTGGSATFESLRKSGMGFGGLWRPGDV
eukprot:scaffold39095_cov48-Attheya_sp.AAC.5